MSKLQIKRLIVTALLALTISPISSNAAEEKVVAVVNGSNILESTLNLYQQRRGRQDLCRPSDGDGFHGPADHV